MEEEQGGIVAMEVIKLEAKLRHERERKGKKNAERGERNEERQRKKERQTINAGITERHHEERV
jgi:hypothetical protein